VNSLAFCSQEVLSSAEEMKEAAVGVAEEQSNKSARDTRRGFEAATIAAFLRRNAESLKAATLPERGGVSAPAIATEAASTLQKLAMEIEQQKLSRLEDLERRLTVLEEKIFAALLASTPDEEVVTVRTEADRDLAPYRRKMGAAQIDHLQKQYVQKRLLEKYKVPRLSLFYM
jgi:hypothetical protein